MSEWMTDGAPDVVVLTNKSVVSAKDRDCSWCRQPISKGEEYRRVVFTEDGAFRSEAVHVRCYFGDGED